MNRDKLEYVVFGFYSRGTVRALRIDASNLKDALREARDYRAPNLLLMDSFGNQYVARVKGLDVMSPRKNRCVTKGRLAKVMSRQTGILVKEV